jgi:hypothetical protein
MSTQYQQRDYDVVDYELFPLLGFERLFRGPRPQSLDPGEYFICIGAAQTFGCYCPKPFPTLLSERLDLPVLNMGIAGAGPAHFKERRPFLWYMNAARFAVVQVMSGRSESNSLFETDGREMLRRRSNGEKIAASLAYNELLETLRPEEVDVIVAETRDNWVKSMRDLLASIHVPKILLWLSIRSPEYIPGYDNERTLLGAFPQFVNRAMMDALLDQVDEYVEVVTHRGFPQRLFNRFTGEPALIQTRADLGGKTKSINDYYPSPEMHVDAADALEPACRRVLARC